MEFKFPPKFSFTFRLVLCLMLFASHVKLGDADDNTTEATTTLVPPPEAPEPVESNYDKCNLPNLGTDKPQPVPENMMRMGPNSKYFILSGENDVPISEIASLCQSIGLQPAEIRNKVELMAITVFLKESAPESVMFSLGLQDQNEEGTFVEFDGSPMSFHAFVEMEPYGKAEDEDCVRVSVHPYLKQLVYDDVGCNESVTPMCMFKPTDECYLADPQTLAKVNQDFELVGSSSVRDYYLKMKQYSHPDAAAVCEKAGYKLVDFSTGLSNNQMLYDLIRKWLDKNLIPARVAFWTGGKIVEKDSVSTTDKPGESTKPSYKFEHSGKLLSDLSEWPSLSWDTDEPSDAAGLGLETCISTVLYHPYSAASDNIFSLATTNCRLPHYPLCFQEKILAPTNAIVENTTADTTTLAPLAARMLFSPDDIGRFCTLKEVKVDLSKPQLSHKELLQLAAVSRHKDLGSADYRFEWAVEKPWLSSIIEKIYLIPKKACPDEFVPPEYINVMHNLLILYYNAVAHQLKDPAPAEITFLAAKSYNLTQCHRLATPLKLKSMGGLPTTLGELSVTPILETVDSYTDAKGNSLIEDRVIDTFWYLYLVLVGTCYPYEPASKTYYVAEFHNLFTKYFLEVFQRRWFSGKKEVDWGILMGDMDEEAVYQSLRSCAIAAFHNSNITELYLPRPVFMEMDVRDIINKKVQSL